VARDEKGRSEDDWRSIVDRSKAAVSNGELRVRELETKAKQLENDFYAMSDGNRRDAVVKPAWDKAREDLAKARQELEDARKAFEDLSEEARKSNAPPGWLR
jgi:predicted  nucleic acid-binding Zn-ribbon protein